uniref:Translation initiation factor 1 n=1 Tax=Chlorophytum comosum TaxID=34182 RepID=A0A890CJ46_CHLCM|nr:translation initiation factor 1 [Chlorophytum comosum]WBP65052.1 translational initiation factor 1 [Chlorophytum comosum]
MKEQKLINEGLITESLPNSMFRVHIIWIWRNFNLIRILPGDRIKIEISRSTRGV